MIKVFYRRHTIGPFYISERGYKRERHKTEDVTKYVEGLEARLAELEGAIDEIAHFDPKSEYGAAYASYDANALEHVQDIARAVSKQEAKPE